MSDGASHRPGVMQRVSTARLFVLGFGFLGIEVLWNTYNSFVPIFLQAGRADYAKGAGVHGFGVSSFWNGVIMTLDNVAALFMLPWVGAFSDRLRTRIGRRKPFMLIGAPIAAAAFGAVPYALGHPLWIFMAGIVMTFLAMNLFRAPTVALMPDITPSPQRSVANGVINLMGGLGGMIAGYVGGALFKRSVQSPLVFGALAMLLAVVLVLVFVTEPEPEKAGEAEEEPSLIASLKQVLADRDRSALLILVALFSWYLGHSAILVNFGSYAINSLHIDAGEATKTFFWFNAALMGGSIPGGWLGARFGRRRTMTTGLVAMAAIYVTFLWVPSVEVARYALIAAGVAWATVTVNALPMVVDCAPPARIGTYTGLYYLSAQSAQIVGPIAAGLIVQLAGNRYQAVFPYTAATMLLAFIALVGVRRGEARTQLTSP